MEALETETDLERLGAIQFELEAIDSFTAEARAGKILAGLGFSEYAQQQPLNHFSGGWRMRVALASVLYNKPDLMLLDEPSNHLDLETTFWLIDYLKKDPCALILISHDKYILNEVVQKIVHLHSKTLTSYTGNYDTFSETRFLRMAQLEAAHAKQQEQRAHIQKFVDRFRAKATKAAQVQSRLKMLSKMEEVQLLRDDSTLSIQFPQPADLSPPLISLEKASVGYEEKVILKNLNQRIDPQECIALVGRNGNGKSTFAKLLSGHLPPMHGERKVYQNFSVAFFQQDQLENLIPTQTAYEHLEVLMPNTSPTHIRNLLGQFGLTQSKADLPVKNLSGGEKTRLNFALLSRDTPGLLILDEPTNHLDIESREALTLSINQFKGAVILITHDWDLLKLTATNLWVVENGTVQTFEGSLETYQRDILGLSQDRKKEDKKRAQSIREKKMKKKKK
jgi:ATP-binding cassette subfamily F protein 3